MLMNAGDVNETTTCIFTNIDGWRFIPLLMAIIFVLLLVGYVTLLIDIPIYSRTVDVNHKARKIPLLFVQFIYLPFP